MPLAPLLLLPAYISLLVQQLAVFCVLFAHSSAHPQVLIASEEAPQPQSLLLLLLLLLPLSQPLLLLLPAGFLPLLVQQLAVLGVLLAHAAHIHRS